MRASESKRKRRWFRRALLVAVGCAALFSLVGYTGYPQRRTAEWAIARSTGLIAVVEWGGTVPELRIDRLYLYATPEAYTARLPLVTVLGIRVGYASLAEGRKLDRVDVGQVLVDLDPNDPALRELPFLKSDPEAKLDATFIPRQITFEGITVKLRDSSGTLFLLDDFAADIDLADPESPSIVVRAEDTRVEFDSGDAHLRLADVELNGEGRIEDGRLSWHQTIENADVFRLALDADGPISGDDPHINLSIREASLKGDDLAGVLESLQAPVEFSEFGVESATAKVSLGEKMAFNVSAAVKVYGPRLPSSTEPLYADAIHVSLKAEQAEVFQGDVEVELAKGQRARATVRGSSDEGNANAALAGWSRDQFVDAIPAAFRESVEGLSFETFASEVKLNWTKDTFAVDGQANSEGGGAQTAPISWALQAQGPRDGGQGIEGNAEARLGDRHVRASARYESADHYLAEATIEQVNIAPWVALIAGDEAAAPFGGTIEGVVRAEGKGKNAPLEIRPDITLKNFLYDTLELAEITAKGAIQYNSAEGRATIGEFRVEAPDGMTSAILTGWTYDTKAKHGGGAFALSADLGILAHLLDEPTLYGSGGLEGKALLDGATMNADFTIASRDLNYAGLSMPYSTKLNGAGAVTFDRETRRGEMRELKASIGDGTTISVGATPFATRPVSAEGDISISSDMQILAAMLWLDEKSQGTFSASAAFHLADESLRADWKVGMTAPQLILTEDGGTAEAVQFDGAGSYDGALSGTGSIRAAKLMAAGGSVLNVSGPVLFDGDQMRIQQAKGELFRGSVNADVDIGVLREGLPIALSGSFEGADLAILTDEVKPPKTQLTGTARGTVSVAYDAKGLQAFSFEAQAPAGLSVNRSLVEELLQSDTFLSGAGANVAEKAMDKLLGTAPQRPFDRGSMTVQLENEKITGLAVLESTKTKDYNGLNLRVTLDMDQSTLAQSLKMLQEASSATIGP